MTRDGGLDIDPLLLEVVACPSCKGPLSVEEGGLQCAACALVYPVSDGIPVLLADAARSIRATEETTGTGGTADADETAGGSGS